MNLDYIKTILSYDENTGIFTWLVDRNRFKCKGKEAGCVNPRGYNIIVINGRGYRAHQLAMLFKTNIFSSNGIDHINGNKSDNRASNLRFCNQKDNSKNRLLSKSNSTGFNGVYFNKQKKKFTAQIRVDNRLVYLGAFNEKEDAIAARKKANIEYSFHKNHGRKDARQ